MEGLERYTQANLRTVDLSRFSAINAMHEKEELSEKYRFIPTTRVINVLEGMGWYPVKASEMSVRSDGRSGFQKHMIRFRQNGTTSIIQKDQVFPEIVLTNSHDGLASFQIMAGLYRVVCSNGLTVADSLFETHRIKHIGYADQHVREAVESVLDSVPRIAGRVDEFREIELTKDEQGVYAMAALASKYGEDELEKREFRIDRILMPMRSADQPPTLWHTFNTVQEKLIKGGRYAIKTDPDYPTYKTTVKAKEVKSISKSIMINRALWMLTEKMAELKRAAL
jgi:hypothetical protein